MADAKEIFIKAAIFAVVDLAIAGGVASLWIGNKVLLRWFPQWEGTRKHFVCAAIWGASLLLNVPIYIGVAYALPKEDMNFIVVYLIFILWFFITLAPIKIAKSISMRKRRKNGIIDYDNPDLEEPPNRDNMKPPFS